MREKIIGELMIRNMFKKLIIIFLILNVLLYSFAALNEHHIYECNDENCAICKIIEVAKLLTKYSFRLEISFIYAIFLSLVALFLVDYKNDSLVQKSLLYQKVQFNE